MAGLLAVLLSLLAGALLLVAPVLPLGLVAAVHALSGSGKWAALPPAGLGLPLLTAVVLLYSALAAARRSTARRPAGALSPKSPFGVAAALVAWILLSLLWSPSPEYGLDKAIRLGLLNVVPAFALYLAVAAGAVTVGAVLGALRWGALVISTLGMALSLVVPLDDETSRLSVGGTDPITFGTVGGLGLLLWGMGTGEPGRRRLLLQAVAVVVCGAALVGSNSKGPVVATLATLVALTLRAPSRQSIGRLVGAVLLGSMIFVLAPSSFTSRFDPEIYAQPNQANVSESVSGRTRLYEGAMEQFVHHPAVGGGVGAFNQVPRTKGGVPLPVGGAVQSYPHNIVLEVAAELGIVGIALLVALAGAVASVLRRRTASAPVFAVTVLAAVESMFSGDLSDHRLVWIGLAMAAGQHALATAGGRPVTAPGTAAVTCGPPPA